MRVPLGMVIEETAADHAQPGRVVVTGALPGYSAIGQVLGRGAIRDLKACLSLSLSVACEEASHLQVPCATPRPNQVLAGDFVRGLTAYRQALWHLTQGRVRAHRVPAGPVAPDTGQG